MPATVSHALSMTTPDDPAYENQPKHWNSAHAFTFNASGSEIIGAFSNSNGLSFGTEAGGGITGSYTQSTHAHSAFVLSDSNGLGWGTNGSTVTGSYSQSTHAHTAFVLSNSNGLAWGTNASTVTGSYSQSTHAHSSLSFDNSNGVTFGLNGSTLTATVKTDYQTSGAYLTTAMASNRGTDFVQATAAFAGTNASGTIASGGISVSVAAPGGAVTLSYFDNVPLDHHSGTIDPGGSSIWVAPFLMPQNISASFLRMGKTISHVSTTFGGTSANTTFSGTVFHTDAFVMYSQGTGANSMSLQYVTSGSGGWTIQTRIGNAGQGSQYTVTFNVTYPLLGTNDSTYTTSYAVSSGTYNISSQSMTQFTGWRFNDIPFAASLSPGNYWIGFGESTTTSNNGPAGLVGASLGMSWIGASQTATSVGYPGQATNTSIQFQVGLGFWTTNSNILSTSSVGLASISEMASNVRPFFQLIRRA